MAALTSFPPKLSEVQSILNMPEDMFENTARGAGVEVPPGPNKMLVNMMSSFERMFGEASPMRFPIPTQFPMPFAGVKRGGRVTSTVTTTELATVTTELATPKTEIEAPPTTKPEEEEKFELL
jgi:hypothetical protein